MKASHPTLCPSSSSSNSPGSPETRKPSGSDHSKAGSRPIRDLIIAVKGAGDLATGIACRLYRSGFRKIYLMETPMPMAVRRRVAFAQAVYDRQICVEEIFGILAGSPDQIPGLWKKGQVPVLVDPDWTTLSEFPPDALVDAIIAKKNLGTRREDAPLVIGLGPGFEAGVDAHRVIETHRGHSLGQVLSSGSALENTHIPEPVMGFSSERVLRAPGKGIYQTVLHIGDMVAKGDEIGRIGDEIVSAPISGVIRGLIHDGVSVAKGKKIGDIDPRGEVRYCYMISDKARALGGAVLEAILERFNR